MLGRVTEDSMGTQTFAVCICLTTLETGMASGLAISMPA